MNREVFILRRNLTTLPFHLIIFPLMIALLKKLRDLLYVPLASNVMWLNSLAVNSTVHLDVIGEEKIDLLHSQGKRIIFAFWHQATFRMFYYYRGKKICALPVDNYLGRILAGFFRKYGFRTVTYPERGSPMARTEAIARIIRTIRDEGYDCGIAVDGPPEEAIFKAKPGVFYLAARTGYPILPIGIHYDRARVMNFRWDKYLVPKLFSRAVMVMGDPIYVKENLSDMNIKDMAHDLEDKLHSLTEEAGRLSALKQS